MAQQRKRKQNEIHSLDFGTTVNRMHAAGMHANQIARILEVDAQEVISLLAPSAATEFAKQLLHDSEDLKCPITMELMDDAVVAEDGYTYERAAIQAALRQNLRSPMTNNRIGILLLPNQAIRSQVVAYKEKLVGQVLSVAPTLFQWDPQLACVLLSHGVDVVKPKLPERSAKKTLIHLLGLQLRLPQFPAFADATPAVARELAGLLTNDEDCSHMLEQCLKEEVAITAQMSKAALQQLFHAAIELACPSSICIMLGKTLLRWAPHVESPFDLIWEVSRLLSDAKGDPWTNTAAQAWIIREMQDNGDGRCDMKTSILQRAATALRCLESGCRLPREMFGVATHSFTLHTENCDQLRSNVLLELARRRRLRHDDIPGVASGKLLDIATRLEEESRFVASAEVSVLQAEVSLDHVESAHSFLYAYKLDPENEVAKRGVLRTAPALGQRCRELEQRCKELRKARNDALKQA